MDRRHVLALASLPLMVPATRSATVWHLATGYRADSFHTINLAQMASEIAQATRGALSIELHADNSLARLSDIADAVRTGRAQAGEVIMSGLVAQMPLAGADSVPFIVRSYDDAQRLWKCQRPFIESAFAERGLTVLYAVPWPPQGLYSTQAVAHMADLRGSRMRTYNATTVRIAELVGATPVDVPMVGVGQAMAEGRIDSMITSGVTGVENKVWSRMKFFYEINAWFPKNIVFANAQAFRALDKPVQEAVMRAAGAAQSRGWAASVRASAQALDELRRNGIKVERASPELVKDIKSLGERFSLEWIRAVGPQANGIFIPYFTQS